MASMTRRENGPRAEPNRKVMATCPSRAGKRRRSSSLPWRSPPALQILSITGMPGLSFLLMLANVALASLVWWAWREHRVDWSGAIALAVKHTRLTAQVSATDASLAALDVAVANATRLGLAVEFLAGSWWQPRWGRSGTRRGVPSSR